MIGFLMGVNLIMFLPVFFVFVCLFIFILLLTEYDQRSPRALYE